MTKDSIHLVCNEFSRGIGHDLDWWKHRLEHYEKYTLNSIINQTNKNFYLLMAVDNCFPLRAELDALLEKSGLRYLIYDRTITNDFQRAMETILNFEYVYSTRIDTDDVFHKNVVEEIQQHEYSHRKALVFQKGYCYDTTRKKLQHYIVQSPPFSTILFPKKVFLDDKMRNDYANNQGHDRVFKNMLSEVLSENKYIVLIHGKNLDSVYLEGPQALSLKRFEIPESEHRAILSNFGIIV